MRLSSLAGTLFVTMLSCSVAHAEIKVGFVTSLSGGAASIGIPYSKGLKAALQYQSEIAGEKITVIELDDAADPSVATRNARKLVEEGKVDIIIGTATAPSTTAMMAVAKELKVPMIAISPVNMPEGETDQWGIAVNQPASLMASVLADRMVRDGKKNIAFIGFSDSWGDLCYDGIKAAEADGRVKLLTNERYARTDSAVTGQVLKMLATKPDAVFIGSSATQGALPPLELAKRGFKGGLYGLSPLANADFIRVGGKAVEGVKITVGPVLVAEQLGDDHPSKKIGLAFKDAYQKANNEPSTDNFSPFSFDAWLVFLGAAERALKTSKPGTPEFRAALRDGIFKTEELSGAQAIYTFKQGSYYGVNMGGLVIAKLADGIWRYEP